MKKDYMKYLSSLLIYGSNGVVASGIHMASYEKVFLRVVIGCTILFGIFALMRNRFTFYKYKRDTFFLALSGFSMGIGWLFLFEAYDRIGVGTATLLYYIGPAIVMATAPLFFRERFTPSKLIGFAMVAAGMIFINGQVSGGSGSLLGIFCGLMSAVTYASLVISSKYVQHVKGLENAFLQLFFSGFPVAVYLLMKNGAHLAIASADIPSILFLGIVNTSLGIYLYFSSITGLKAQTVSVLGYLDPLTAVVLGILILGEPAGPVKMLGVALILSGSILAELLSGNKGLTRRRPEKLRRAA